MQGELRFRLRELHAVAQTFDLPHQQGQKLHGFQSPNRRLDGPSATFKDSTVTRASIARRYDLTYHKLITVSAQLGRFLDIYSSISRLLSR